MNKRATTTNIKKRMNFLPFLIARREPMKFPAIAETMQGIAREKSTLPPMSQTAMDATLELKLITLVVPDAFTNSM